MNAELPRVSSWRPTKCRWTSCCGVGLHTKLLANEAVKSYIGRHEPEILTHLELVVNTVSMEEAVQQQQTETAEAALEEATTGL